MIGLNFQSRPPVTFGPTDLPARGFRYDSSTGYLFLDYIDGNDNMYYAYIPTAFLETTGRSIVWQRSQLPFKRKPLFFRGVFRKKEDELFGLLPGKNLFTLWYNDSPEHNTVPRWKFWMHNRKAPAAFQEDMQSGQSKPKKVGESNRFFAQSLLPDGTKSLGLLGLHEDEAGMPLFKLKLERIRIREQQDAEVCWYRSEEHTSELQSPA